MPFRLHNEGFPDRTKIQFTTNVEMPSLIFEACLVTGTISNTVYVQHAVCEALARDLNMPLDRLLASLPEPRGPAKHLYDPAEQTMNRYRSVSTDKTGGRLMPGPANTVENVR
jgi:hypothetical protein